MSNHIHLAVKIDPSQIDVLEPWEVAQRWSCIFKGTLLFQKWREGGHLDSAQLNAVSDEVELYRSRLNDLGWFMKCLNEPIARQANKEDGCTGHFWESRYKSQALMTEEALLSCMTYVDLNPIRAGMADTPETSDHTSIKERISPSFDLAEAVKEQVALESLIKFDVPLKPLAAFEGSVTEQKQFGIFCSMTDYLELVDATGRYVHKNKRGVIPAHLPPILQRLNVDRETWLNNVTCFEKIYNLKFAQRRRPLQQSA
jgi:REP element-mobilizing transposase RayT